MPGYFRPASASKQLLRTIKPGVWAWRTNEEALKLTKAKHGPEHPETLRTMGNLAVAYYTARKLDLALPLWEETLKLQKAKLGPEHPDTLRTMGNLAAAYQAAGKLDLALPLWEETLKLMKAKLGPEHPDTLQSMNNLAWAYQPAGKLDLALLLKEEALKIMKAKHGPEHSDTLNAMATWPWLTWRSRRGKHGSVRTRNSPTPVAGPWNSPQVRRTPSSRTASPRCARLGTRFCSSRRQK